MCFHLQIIQLLEMIMSEICFKIMQFEGRIKMKHNCPSADNYWSWAMDTQRHFTLFFSIPYTLEKFHNKVFFNEDHSALVCFSYFFTFFANWEVGKQAAEPPRLCISLSQALYGFHYFSSSICCVSQMPVRTSDLLTSPSLVRSIFMDFMNVCAALLQFNMRWCLVCHHEPKPLPPCLKNPYAEHWAGRYPLPAGPAT